MRTLLFVFFVFCFASFCNAQVIGKIFEKDVATIEFGKVVSSVEVEYNKLISMLEKTGQYIMLNIDSSNVRAINKDRKSVSGAAKNPEEVFYKMSAGQVALLLLKGGEKTTKIEMRPKTLTLTNGNFTLEYSDPCPPDCE